jgi:hypothetical protein
MNHPDYHGGSIVNLMASLLRARGRPDRPPSPYPEARLLPAAEIARARHVVLLVLDGLGDDWLRRQAPAGWLARHRVGALTSVFPPTTASAITTYLTGDGPQQHAMTGWYMWLQELGSVLAVLPGTPRHGGSGYAGAGIEPAQFFGHRPLFERLLTDSVVISPHSIARSPYNLAHLGSARLRTFKGLSALFRRIAATVKRARTPTTVYAYWPVLDSIGHEHGIESRHARAHLAALDAHLERLQQRLAGTGCLLLVCADHGQLDREPAEVVQLAQLPELAECLRIPLCGEPRSAYCYLRPGREAHFERLCAEHLAAGFELFRSDALLRDGLFGLGEAHPRLHERIGDYTLIARDRAVIHDGFGNDRAFPQVGVHGGLSDAELMVPLCACAA